MTQTNKGVTLVTQIIKDIELGQKGWGQGKCFFHMQFNKQIDRGIIHELQPNKGFRINTLLKQ